MLSLGSVSKWLKHVPQGLKPDTDLISFIGPTKVVALLQGLRSGGRREFLSKL